MSEPFELFDAQGAWDFLAGFDAGTRRKGEAYFREDRVRELRPQTPGLAYTATVQGTQLYQVDVAFHEGDGWDGACSCPVGRDCKHVYAAMKALLAEHNLATVRLLSAQGKDAPASSSTPARPTPGPLDEKLAAALGRPLTRSEAKFVHRVREVCQRCQQARRITRWDFEQMGLPLGGYGWEALPIWPAVPQTEHEFWLYVANAAQEHGVPIPDFLAPLTDLNPIRERLARWRRSREVERWKHALSQRLWATPGRVEVTGETDLRVVVNETAAVLHWRRPGQEQFSEIKPTAFRQAAEDYHWGRLQFTPEAELLWEAFQQRVDYGRSLHLDYDDPSARDTLGRLARLRALANRLVDLQGQPLARPAEPLRWQLTPAASAEDDYRLRLVQADGTPVPPLLCVLPGVPALYLTPQAIFSGPSVQEHVLDPRTENVIPAPAIESRAGLAFLQGLGVELPPRLRERVRTVPMKVAVCCQLRPSNPGSTAEVCQVQVLAEAADGSLREFWNGYEWIQRSPLGRPQGDKEKSTLILYDRAAQADVPRCLEPLGLKPDPDTGQLVTRVTKKFPAVFVAWLKSMPPHLPVHLEGELASFTQGDVAGQVRLDVTEAAIDWFDLRVVLDVSDTTLTPEELRLLLNAKGNYVRLAGKGWRRLAFNLTQEDDERLARLGLSPHALSAEPQRLHALQLDDAAAKKFLPEDQVEHIHRRAREIKARVTPALPAGVTAELRPYQRDGFHFLAYLATNHFGGILADDMGLGKTVQALAWLVWLRESRAGVPPAPGQAAGETPAPLPNGTAETPAPLPDGVGGTPAPPSLVVCPKSVMDNWQAEAARFTPALRVKVWRASELDTFLERLGEADLHVLNYSQLRMLGESLAPRAWLAVILDEGQYIKNPGSQTAQVARALRAEHRLVLSGTPIENRLLDLWSLMAFAMPGVLGSRAQFARLYDAKGDPLARQRLAARVRPFLLRRTKAQVAPDLPDRIEEDLFCEIEGEQQTLYRAELKRAQQMLLRITTQKQLASERFHFLTSLLRLRQICCHPALVNPESQGASAKVEALFEQLEPLMDEGHKVLVFSQFVEMLGLLRPLLAARGWPVFYLAGETENRGELVREFQSAQGPGVFLISLKAGGFGLNLTAASYVMLFDPWWNPAVENQAIDRTHRIGQDRKVMAYRLLIKGSVEEKIRALQKQKKALAEDVLGEERFAQSLTLEDLQFLFAD